MYRLKMERDNRKRDNEGELNMYPDPHILMVIKTKTRWTRYVASMEMRNAFIILVGKLYKKMTLKT
jgi:hypothetical protein